MTAAARKAKVRTLLSILPVSAAAICLLTVGIPVAATPTIDPAVDTAASQTMPAAPPVRPTATANVAATTSATQGTADGTGQTTTPTAHDEGSASTVSAVTPGAAIGALFTLGADGGLEDHFCSASVVHSAAGDVVLTAAHCIHDGAGGSYHTDIAFVPGYHDHIAPYGIWNVTGEFVSSDWASTSDPDEDYGFLIVHRSGTSQPIEALTGAEQLGINYGFTNLVTITGYPDITDSPVTCSNSTTQQDTYQMRIDCPGFPDGTSGGPWVIDADPATGLGTVIGVIGGYQLGGDDPDTSYSAYFDDDIQDLYDIAAAAG